MAKQVEINVRSQFTLTHTDGATELFFPGKQKVDEDTANHWWVKAHSFDEVGSDKYAQTARAKADELRAKANEADQAALEAEADADAAEEAALQAKQLQPEGAAGNESTEVVTLNDKQPGPDEGIVKGKSK